MSEKKTYSEELKKTVLKEYQSGLGIVKIGKLHHIGPLKIREFLMEQGIDSRIIRKNTYPMGYWDNYETVEDAFKQCKTLKEIKERFLGAYQSSKRNGWYKELYSRYFADPSFTKSDDESAAYILYAYEIIGEHKVFVGETKNMGKCDYMNRKDSNGINITKYCNENHIELPQPKILGKNLTTNDCQILKSETFQKYANDGWEILNKNVDSKELLLLSRKNLKWDYETCKEAASLCKNRNEFKKRFGRACQISRDNRWIDEFIPELAKNKNGCFDSLEQCKTAALDFKSIMDIRKNYPFLYRRISENKWVEEIRQAINDNSKKNDKGDKTQAFIEKARKIHGDKYDYSKVAYVTGEQAVCIICPKHGEFWQRPRVHLRGRGCRQCWIDGISTKLSSNTEEFIKKARKVHRNKYDYSKVDYKGTTTKVTIICPVHGEFEQTPNSHLNGNGCYQCGRDTSGLKLRLTQDEFISRCNIIHNNKYDYSKTIFKGQVNPITITCPKHGDFIQNAGLHLRGCGCPKCGNITSTAEYELRDYIESLIGKDKVIMHDKLLMRNGKELDLVVPDYKLAIEYDGLVWHSEKYGADRYYHVNKTNACEAIGYRLLHIYEDEWKSHKSIILSKIRHILGGDGIIPCIGARKCLICEINKDSAEDLLNQYHIQGFVGASVYLGAFYKDELVGVMTFKKDGEESWDLSRFATVDKYRLPGLANKLFKHFVNEYNPDYVKSFLDRRWNNPGNTVYEKLGFEVEEIEKPDYYYVTNAGHDRCHKFGFRKQILHRKYGFPLTMTEREMTEELGFFKIWNCGLIKYSWKKTVNP